MKTQPGGRIDRLAAPVPVAWKVAQALPGHVEFQPSGLPMFPAAINLHSEAGMRLVDRQRRRCVQTLSVFICFSKNCCKTDI